MLVLKITAKIADGIIMKVKAANIGIWRLGGAAGLRLHIYIITIDIGGMIHV